jgi:hypothetical protein
MTGDDHVDGTFSHVIIGLNVITPVLKAYVYGLYVVGIISKQC